MAKHTLEILRFEHQKIFKVCLAISQHNKGLKKVAKISNTQLVPAMQFEFDLISNSGKKYASVSKQTQNVDHASAAEANELEVVTTKFLKFLNILFKVDNYQVNIHSQ